MKQVMTEHASYLYSITGALEASREVKGSKMADSAGETSAAHETALRAA